MVDIMDLDKISKKWSDRASIADQDYGEAAAQAGDKYLTNAVAGADNYKTAVTTAANQGRYAAGIKKRGKEKYIDRIKKFGPQRYKESVSVSQADHMDGFKPYFDALKSLKLNPKFPTGDPRNYQRVQQVGDTNHKKKLELLGVK